MASPYRSLLLYALSCVVCLVALSAGIDSLPGAVRPSDVFVLGVCLVLQQVAVGMIGMVRPRFRSVLWPMYSGCLYAVCVMALPLVRPMAGMPAAVRTTMYFSLALVLWSGLFALSLLFLVMSAEMRRKAA